ncbi:hypothetical protein GPJ81_11990 [Pseudomonas alkylphenolica]|uniref:Uncharacterized protein n=1 Tax=Pseudomonas alkylphenolica TaxID=237609 RepID=A0A6I6GSH1_9PSED|nr:hypothetical protein [Pseudomonas alkylphenolica]QGW77370.1 hypothetical protein GPJ81_11990 [Pseudomonas alkylphenolica]
MERVTVSTNSYRAFRDSVLKQAKKDRDSARAWPYQEDEDQPAYHRRREEIQLARRWVCKTLQSLLVQTPESEPHIRRLLGITSTVPLIPEHWTSFREIGQWFVPLFLTWPYVRGVMQGVKTYEGRSYLFENLYKRVLACRLEYYTPAVDLALRHLETPSLQEARDLSMQDPGWVEATYTLGLRKLAQITPYARYGQRKLDGAFADILVKTKVITTVDELQWLDYREPYDYNRSERHASTWRKVRKMVTLMSSHGIARRSIAEMFKYSLSSFNAEQLESNLSCIQGSGVQDTTVLFDAVGELLWRAKPANWDFVLNVVGAKSAQEIQRFTKLLEAYKPPSLDMARALIALGAGVDGLAQCQTLLMNAERNGRAAPVAALQCLADPPHELDIEHLARCNDYLEYSEKLPDYLAVLNRYGYGAAAAVVAFQICFRNTYAQTLESWLAILGERGAGVQLETIADWVRQSNEGGYSDSYQYLIQAIPMPDLKHLQQAEPIVRFGRPFLEFVVLRKGLASIQQLRDWYFKARGVQNLKCWSALDAVRLVVLDDAYARNNFAFVDSNEAAISGALCERVDGILGTRLNLADEVARDQYDQAYKTTRSAERAALLPILPTILAQTGGLLLQSVLRYAWQPPQVLQAQLSALTPLVNGLLAGKGPTGGSLTELEADAIGMLYRTAPDTVGRTWSQVSGHEHHLASLTLSSHYPMEWTRSMRRLREPLERSSLLALAQAKTFSRKFSPYESESTFDACKHLRGKRLDDKASDPWSLAAHLGVLFAVASGDSVLDHWFQHELDGLAQVVEEGADVVLRLEQLDQIFSTTLPDALNKHGETFARRFSDADASFLATRLVGSKAPLQGATGREQLLNALSKAQEVVLSTCVRWMQREQRKFVKIKQGQNVTNLNAILTKHPAAYFAKHAANLCSRENVSMWHEKRCAHLVVFDPVQRRLAGIALVYIQPICALDRSRNSLIIRAINPMDDMLATHSVSSIVDAFLDVAIAIAEANNLAAVAIPWHNGAHLLSNQRAIEKDLEKRFTNRAVSYSAPHHSGAANVDSVEWRTRPRSVEAKFYAYAHGDEEVTKLFAIWASGLMESAVKSEYASFEG